MYTAIVIVIWLIGVGFTYCCMVIWPSQVRTSVELLVSINRYRILLCCLFLWIPIILIGIINRVVGFRWGFKKTPKQWCDTFKY